MPIGKVTLVNLRVLPVDMVDNFLLLIGTGNLHHEDVGLKHGLGKELT